MAQVGTIRTEGSGFFAIDFDGVESTVAGTLMNVLNPEGVDLFITRSWLLFRTASTAAANLTIGVAATGATEGTDIINALAAASTTGKCYNGNAHVVATKTELATTPALWPHDGYITAKGSATTVGMKATLFVEYIRTAATA